MRHRTKLRIGCHKLRIESGRHNRTPLQQSQFCTSNMVEDEVHVIVDCAMYVIDRKTLFSYIESRFPHFRHMSSTDTRTFIFLMRFNKQTNHS